MEGEAYLLRRSRDIKAEQRNITVNLPPSHLPSLNPFESGRQCESWKSPHPEVIQTNTLHGSQTPVFIMSQEYFPGEGSSRAGSSRFAGEEEERSPFNPRAPPAYMTVGSGSTSESATALMTSLNQDSGYGGSIAGDSTVESDSSAAWRAGLLEDRPTPIHTPTRSGEYNPAGE